jgi:hypothetical protein
MVSIVSFFKKADDKKHSHVVVMTPEIIELAPMKEDATWSSRPQKSSNEHGTQEEALESLGRKDKAFDRA